MPRLQTILLPTDPWTASDDTYTYALRIALGASGSLHVLHISSDGANADGMVEPGIEKTLERWRSGGGVANPDPPLVVRVSQIESPELGRGIVDQVYRLGCDLVVMTAHARSGMSHFFRASVAESVARQVPVPTLFVPEAARELVSRRDGAVHLDHVVLLVIPGAHHSAALVALARLSATLGVERIHVELVYVGEREAAPDVDLDAYGKWSFSTTFVPTHNTGAAVAEVVERVHADLVVVTTQAHETLADSLWGNTCERVLRHSLCTVLAVPGGWLP